jgi:hypothetical protein
MTDNNLSPFEGTFFGMPFSLNGLLPVGIMLLLSVVLLHVLKNALKSGVLEWSDHKTNRLNQPRMFMFHAIFLALSAFGLIAASAVVFFDLGIKP